MIDWEWLEYEVAKVLRVFILGEFKETNELKAMVDQLYAQMMGWA